jgi:hypothetical protein
MPNVLINAYPCEAELLASSSAQNSQEMNRKLAARQLIRGAKAIVGLAFHNGPIENLRTGAGACAMTAGVLPGRRTNEAGITSTPGSSTAEIRGQFRRGYCAPARWRIRMIFSASSAPIVPGLYCLAYWRA